MFQTPDIQAEKLQEASDMLKSLSLDELLKQVVDSMVKFAINLAIAIIVFYIGKFIISRIHNVIALILLRRKADKSLTTFLLSLVRIVLYFVLIIICVGILGIETSSFLALFASAGVAIGMALSGTVQNFAGGIMILMFKPFKAGDYIEALGYSGKVAEVNIVSTKLRTFDNRTIILPNGSLSNGNINNYFEHSVNRLEWLVSVEYATDNEKAKEVMMGILKSDPRILDSSTDGAADPFVALNALKDSSVEYTMKAWVKVEDYWDVKYSINEAIFTELPKNGINFPFPQLDVHVKN